MTMTMMAIGRSPCRWCVVLGYAIFLLLPLLLQRVHGVAGAFLSTGGLFHSCHCNKNEWGGYSYFSSRLHAAKLTLSCQNHDDDISTTTTTTTVTTTPSFTPSGTDDNVFSTSLVSRSVFLASILTMAAVPATAAAASVATSTSILSNIQHRSSNSKEEQKVRTTLAESFWSGSIAGAALTLTKTLVKFPLDTVTVRLQMPKQAGDDGSNGYSIFRLAELFQDCYRGVWTPLLANIPAGAVFFAVKDAVQKRLENDNDSVDNNGVEPLSLPLWLTTSVAVAVAQIPYWIVRNPSEVVKTRQQAGIDGYSRGVSSWQAYQQVWQDAAARLASTDENGKGTIISIESSSTTPKIRFVPDQQEREQESSSSSLSAKASRMAKAYYLGYGENIVYAYPADVIKFIIYESFKKRKRQKLTPVEGAVAGAVATGIAQFVTTPLDVIRNRIMTRHAKQHQRQQQLLQGEEEGEGQTGSSSVDDDDHQNNMQQQPSSSSYVEALVQLGREEGLAGLFAGAAPRVGKAVLSGAIQFATYEETKQKMADLFARRRSRRP
jgi:solute carrier family 25 (mitochondrial S-adenosylmethionine transporter), member 26